MKHKDKQLAEAVLRRLCEGAEISGVRFSAIPQMLLTRGSYEPQPIAGQVYLNLESRWTVFDSLPERMPESEDDLPDATTEEEILAVYALRNRVITEVKLGRTYPHLIMTLDNGRVMFVNGNHVAYECWQMGVSYNPKETWLVVACPGGDVAIWAPESFVHQRA